MAERFPLAKRRGKHISAEFDPPSLATGMQADLTIDALDRIKGEGEKVWVNLERFVNGEWANIGGARFGGYGANDYKGKDGKGKLTVKVGMPDLDKYKLRWVVESENDVTYRLVNAPTFDQASAGHTSASGASSANVSFSSTPASGSLVIAYWGCWAGTANTTMSSVTDNQSNGYTLVAEVLSPDTEGTCGMSRVANATSSGTFTVTVNLNNSTDFGIGCASYTGIATSSELLDSATTSSDAGGSSPMTVGPVAAGTNNLVVSVLHMAGSSTITPDGSFTQRTETESDGNFGGLNIADILEASGNTSSDWAFGTTVRREAIIAAFDKAAAGGGGTDEVPVYQSMVGGMNDLVGGMGHA